MTALPVSSVVIETATAHEREVRTATELRDLLSTYDLSGLQWTSRVRIEYRAVSHSHPVVTVNTLNTGLRLFDTYVHEQVHWWLADHPGADPAIQATRRGWPTVPGLDDGGARSELSTRLHLLVCHLEHRILQTVTTPAGARRLVVDKISVRRVYAWIYTQVTERGGVLDQLCDDHELWPHRLVVGGWRT